MAKYKWNEIRAKWETGKYTMKDLSDEYGFNENYGHRKASEKKWEKGKSKELVRKKAAKKVLDRISKSEADIKYELYETVQMIKQKMQGEWNNKNNPDFDILKASKISTEILGNILDMEYELLDIQKVAKRIEQEIEHSGSIENKVEYIEKYLKDG